MKNYVSRLYQVKYIERSFPCMGYINQRSDGRWRFWKLKYIVQQYALFSNTMKVTKKLHHYCSNKLGVIDIVDNYHHFSCEVIHHVYWGWQILYWHMWLYCYIPKRSRYVTRVCVISWIWKRKASKLLKYLFSLIIAT